MTYKFFPPFFIGVLLIGFLTNCEHEAAITNLSEPMEIVLEKEATKALAEKIRKEVNVELDDEITLDLWAVDTLSPDPIAISIDEQGRLFFNRAVRLSNSEFDIRGHRDWMTASISFETPEDRRTFIRETFSETNEQGKKFLKDLNEDGILDWKDLKVEKEEVWFIEDTDGDQIADKARRYLQDFNEEITDLALGIEAHRGKVFVSVGPDLWKVEDQDGDGQADKKESLAHGFAVHIGFGAHGLSGAKIGPDGRIWWGIGDIGSNVVDQKGKRWKYPNQGVIVRAEQDGSNYEVYSAGLRNTHEFVFDKYGNLITEDNDGDHEGERERLVYLINGSDCGWRINWQFGKYTDPDNNKYKVWMDEKMHIPRWDGQAAYILPPIVNYINGPTGMVYNPGTALGPEWEDHFFIAEFRGTPAVSPVHGFSLKPNGAGFALDRTRQLVKGLLPSGLDFGPDGALYIADWIDGWNTNQQGRIWKMDVKSQENDQIRKETAAIIKSDFSVKDHEELKNLLGHKDMRIRQAAQFELVDKGSDCITIFNAVMNNSQNQMARIHAIWGLAQYARLNQIDEVVALESLLEDADVEIVSQAVKMLGDVKFHAASSKIIPLLKHSNKRLVLHATEALGRLESKEAVQGILQMLEKNNDEDTWLRHAGMIALGRIADEPALAELKDHPSVALRTAAIVALRRMKSPKIALFLNDPSEYLVTEAARGINDDYSIPEALPQLAKCLDEPRFTNEALIRRAINANLRVGKAENIELLSRYANNKNASEELRAEAIAALSTWANPSPLDRVDGRYRGAQERSILDVRSAFLKLHSSLLADENELVQIGGLNALGKLGMVAINPIVYDLFNSSKSYDVKAACLNTLQKNEYKGMSELLDHAFKTNSSQLRSTALSLLPLSNITDEAAIPIYTGILQNGTLKEKQSAYAALSKSRSNNVFELLSTQLEQLIAGNIQKEVRLDLIVAAENQEDESLNQLLAKYQSIKKQNDLSEFAETLHGGDSRKGSSIFYENEAVQCVRCHAVFEYGGNAGPVLSGVGKRLTSEEILESLILPSKSFASGYEMLSLDMKNGESIAGIVMKETENQLTLKQGNESIVDVDTKEITEKRTVPSSMLSVKTILSKKEIRDLISFLESLE